MFISVAYAEGFAEVSSQSLLTGFMPWILILAIFYLLILRPQAKRQKQQQAMLLALRRGDKIVTIGGLHGEISQVVDDTTLEIDINPQTTVTIETQAVSRVTLRASDKKASRIAKKAKKKSSKKKTV